jgi:hypothetical protein
MPLTAGGADGTTTLAVTPRNGDGKNGCNLTGSTTLVLSVSSSNPSVATVSPSSVTFTSCSDTAALTVTPVATGSASISASQTSNNTGGTFNLAPATFTVNVTPPPNTAPTVTVGGVTGGASYAKGTVPVATCNVLDAEDGPSSFPATLSAVTGPFASDGIGQQTASCSYTDEGPGTPLTASASEMYSIFDPSPPVITPNVSGTLGNGGWYTSDVSLSWTVSDPESPNSIQKTGCASQNITADQAETTYSCSATSAGGSTGPVEQKIKRDATAPTDIAFVGGDLSDDGSYDFNSVPAGPTSCTADGAISGLKSPNGCVLSGYSTAVGPQAVTATAEDNAGNTATSTLSYTVAAATAKGFYQPVDMGNVTNTVKGGSTVPLKFELFGGATNVEQKDVSAASVSAKQITCGTTPGASDAIEEIVSTNATGLRFDTTGDQFIYNWKTPKSPGTCYLVTMTAADQQTKLLAYFQLK